MKNEESQSSIVHNGGWKEVEVTETVHGFRYYLVWFIIISIALIISIFSHIETNGNLFTFGNTGPILIVALFAQVYFTWKLIKTYGQKTETVTYKTEVSNPDHDDRNLY